jgi:predicted PurR-regulated permease PerM
LRDNGVRRDGMSGEERARNSGEASAGRRRLTIDISGAAIVKVSIAILVLGVVSTLFSQMRDLFVWILTALFFAIALNPLVERLEPRIGRRPAATVVVVGSAIAFLGVLVALIAPFVTQVDQLSSAIPKAISEAKHNSTVQRLDHRFHLAQAAQNHLDSLPNVIFGAADTILNGAFAISTIFFLTLFLLYELPAIGNTILGQIPAKSRPRARAAARHINSNIGGYVAGNLVISVICGTVTTVALFVLHVPYSLALGVFMGVFDIIPLVGATIGSFVVVAAGLIFVDAQTAIILFAIVNVYQQIENHVLQPWIYGKTVQIPSLTILIGVLAGGAALGLVGALLAIPVAATIQAVIAELLEERAMRMDELPATTST